MHQRLHHPRIRAARPDDAAALAAFGAAAFAESFAHTTTPADLALFLARTYSPKRQRAEIEHPDAYVAVADAEPDAPSPVAGYVMLRAGEPPPCVRGPAPVELARIYVAPGAIGRGLGGRLLEHAGAEALRRGFRTLWLGVWEHNARAIAFYSRHGFRDVGAHVFLLGTDAQTDRVMEAALDVAR